MDFVLHIIDFVLHFDKHLYELVNSYGAWVYGILFGIIFAETGLVVTPFLPGDSLLFAAGALAVSSGSATTMVSRGGGTWAAAGSAVQTSRARSSALVTACARGGASTAR